MRESQGEKEQSSKKRRAVKEQGANFHNNKVKKKKRHNRGSADVQGADKKRMGKKQSAKLKRIEPLVRKSTKASKGKDSTEKRKAGKVQNKEV